jgi:hypothetical protein
MQTVTEIVQEFVSKITEAVEEGTRQRVLEVAGKIGSNGSNGHARHARPAPKAKATPEQQKARKLQGQYMGNIRALPRKDIEKVKALREKKGIEAAIKLAVQLKNALPVVPKKPKSDWGNTWAKKR